jgi:hypothetical protein
MNVAKELDALQRDYRLPFICSSNARHVVETLKGNAGLDATASAGKTTMNLQLAIISFCQWL